MTDPLGSAPFDRLDFLYVPSRDVASDLATFEDVLGGRVVFAVESMGTRVAAVRLTDDPPLVLLTDHLEGDRPILVYRVDDLEAALTELEGEAGVASARSRSRTGRSARSRCRAVTAWRCISSRGRRSARTSRAAATSEDQRRSRTTTGIERMPFVFSR